MLTTGIEKDSGNPITGYVVKDAETERTFIIPEDGLVIENNKPVIIKIAEIEILSEKTVTPFVDAVNYPICIGDIMQTRDNVVGKVELRDNAPVLSVESDCERRLYFLSKAWILKNAAQVVRDEYAGYIKAYRAGYAKEYFGKE